jgi:hypothetical protein
MGRLARVGGLSKPAFTDISNKFQMEKLVVTCMADRPARGRSCNTPGVTQGPGSIQALMTCYHMCLSKGGRAPKLWKAWIK